MVSTLNLGGFKFQVQQAWEWPNHPRPQAAFYAAETRLRVIDEHADSLSAGQHSRISGQSGNCRIWYEKRMRLPVIRELERSFATHKEHRYMTVGMDLESGDIMRAQEGARLLGRL